jgi:hypothetical protein
MKIKKHTFSTLVLELFFPLIETVGNWKSKKSKNRHALVRNSLTIDNNFSPMELCLLLSIRKILKKLFSKTLFYLDPDPYGGIDPDWDKNDESGVLLVKTFITVYWTWYRTGTVFLVVYCSILVLLKLKKWSLSLSINVAGCFTLNDC